MSYGIATVVSGDVAAAIPRVKEALAAEGFGVLSEIDVAATLKDRLGADVAAHVILGACNPPLALRAVTTDPSVGLLLPCNVVVRDDHGRTVVEAIDPAALAPAIDSPGLQAVASEARDKLAAAIALLAGS